jgi:hypothetical protein
VAQTFFAAEIEGGDDAGEENRWKTKKQVVFFHNAMVISIGLARFRHSQPVSRQR